jgi:pyrroloquinoline quinone biosynthesis protein D
MITGTARLTLDSRVRFRRFEHEGIVINQKTAEALVMSEVATRLLEITDGQKTLADCVAVLATEFDAPANDIARDVLAFAAELVDSGIVGVA